MSEKHHQNQMHFITALKIELSIVSLKMFHGQSAVVHRFGPEWNISAFIWWIGTRVCTDLHCFEMMKWLLQNHHKVDIFFCFSVKKNLDSIWMDCQEMVPRGWILITSPDLSSSRSKVFSEIQSSVVHRWCNLGNAGVPTNFSILALSFCACYHAYLFI